MMMEYERTAYKAHLAKGGKKMSDRDWREFYNEKLEKQENERKEAEHNRYMALSPKSRAKEEKAWSDQF